MFFYAGIPFNKQETIIIILILNNFRQYYQTLLGSRNLLSVKYFCHSKRRCIRLPDRGTQIRARKLWDL